MGKGGKRDYKRKEGDFNEFLGNRSVEKWENYRLRCREIKRGVKEAKRRAKERLASRVEEYARRDSKKFWKEVNRVRKKKEEVWGVLEIVRGGGTGSCKGSEDLE